MKVSNSLALSAAIAGLVSGSAALVTAKPASAASADKVDCYNDCAGHTLGKGKDKKTGASCAGSVSVKLTAAECKKEGGSTTAPGAKGGSETTQGHTESTPAQDSGTKH